MEFVHYNTAKLAKEKGYNGTSRVYYDTTGSLYTQTYSEGIGYIPNFSCYAPLQEELSEWLRDDKGIHIIYTPNSVINSDTKLTEELFMLYENALGEALIIALNLLE